MQCNPSLQLLCSPASSIAVVPHLPCQWCAPCARTIASHTSQVVPCRPYGEVSPTRHWHTWLTASLATSHHGSQPHWHPQLSTSTKDSLVPVLKHLCTPSNRPRRPRATFQGCVLGLAHLATRFAQLQGKWTTLAPTLGCTSGGGWGAGGNFDAFGASK